MSRYAWRSPAARSAIDVLSEPHRTRYEEIEAFLSDFPLPIKGTTYLTEFSMFGRHGYRYFDDTFPYGIYYVVEDQEITVLLVLRSATSKTPM